MTQILQSPYAVPVLQIVAGVAVLQIFNGKSHLADYAEEKIRALESELCIAGKKIIHDSPVIAISVALNYASQLFAQRFSIRRDKESIDDNFGLLTRHSNCGHRSATLRCQHTDTQFMGGRHD